MLLKFGIDVISNADEKVGELESVIIDPATEEITHLIVKKGFLFSKTKMIPISLVADSSQEMIKLHEYEGSFEDLPDYVETHFVPLENYISSEIEGKIIPMLFYAPFPVTMSHAAPPGTVPVMQENLAADRESLEEGMDIIAIDGKKMGTVQEIILHPATDRVTHLLVSRGLLFKNRFLIPADWVKEIEESRILLYVDSKVIKNLPAYSEEGILT